MGESEEAECHGYQGTACTCLTRNDSHFLALSKVMWTDGHCQRGRPTHGCLQPCVMCRSSPEGWSAMIAAGRDLAARPPIARRAIETKWSHPSPRTRPLRRSPRAPGGRAGPQGRVGAAGPAYCASARRHASRAITRSRAAGSGRKAPGISGATTHEPPLLDSLAPALARSSICAAQGCYPQHHAGQSLRSPTGDAT